MQFMDRKRERPSINISPLVDVVFLLVIFFTVSTTFREGTGIPVTLPSAGTAVTVLEGPIEVSVGDDGRIDVAGEIYPSLEEARAPLVRAIEGSSDRRVVIRGDRRVHYESIVSLLDIAREFDARVTLAIRRASGSDGGSE